MTRKQLDYDPWEYIESRARNTPDFETLNNSHIDEFMVLMTGKMRRRHLKNHLPFGCNWYGEGSTWGTDFAMKKPVDYSGIGRTDHEPMVFELTKERKKTYKNDFNMNQLGRIEGDVYGVPLRVLTDIDRYQANADVTHREERWVSLNNSLQGINTSCKAYVYTMDFDYYDQACIGNFVLENCNSFTHHQHRVFYY